MWNTELWEPGKTLNWDATSPRHVANLSHEVKIEALNVPPKLQQVTPVPTELPKAPSETIRPTPAPPPARPAPEVLTNETIVKLAKAGLGDEVILGMVNGQPGKYSLDADSVIALKQAGVSNSVISAMMTTRGAASTATSFSLSAAPNVTGPSEPLVLHDSTPVRMRLSRNLSSADAKTGDTIDFEVLDDVTVGDIPVIPRGAVAIGTVTDAEKKRRMARGGKLDVTIDYVRLVTGDKVALRGSKDTAGGGHTGGMTAGIVVTALVVWPAAPFFLFMHGKDSVIPKGTEITAYVNGEIKLDKQKFAGK